MSPGALLLPRPSPDVEIIVQLFGARLGLLDRQHVGDERSQPLLQVRELIGVDGLAIEGRQPRRR